MSPSRLSPFKRCRVIYRDPDTGHSKSVITKDGTVPSKGRLPTKAAFVACTAQRDGTIHIIGTSLIDRIIFESQDRVFGSWHEVGQFNL